MLFLKQSIKKYMPSIVLLYRNVKHKFIYWLAVLQRNNLRQKIISEFTNTTDYEVRELLDFIQKYGVSMIPYFFTHKYSSDDINVVYDETKGYNYVIHLNNKIYFPKEMGEEAIKNAFLQSIIEQDDDSPHKYVSDYHKFDNEECAVLLGASDGIFCLSIIDKFNKLYLFEPDEKWHIPMELTLAKYIKKVEIIKKFASDINDKNSITLDTFSKYAGPISFIQADIEGYEVQMLNGARSLLSSSTNLKLSISSYHGQNDTDDITRLLNEYGYVTKPSERYMIMWMQIPLKKPYLRRGVIYAKKTKLSSNHVYN